MLCYCVTRWVALHFLRGGFQEITGVSVGRHQESFPCHLRIEYDNPRGTVFEAIRNMREFFCCCCCGAVRLRFVYDHSLWPSQPRELLPGGFPQQRGPLYLHHKTRAADTDRDDAYSACTEVNNG